MAGIAIEGTVRSIRMHESEEGRESGSLEIRHGPKPKPSKDGNVPYSFPATTSFDLPNDVLKSYKVGQDVVIEIRPATSSEKIRGKLIKLKQRRY